MILVRNIFQLEFGKAREAKELWKEGKMLIVSNQNQPYRVLFDLTGDSYTMVMEMTFESMAHFETSAQENMGSLEWKSWYQKFIPLCKGGRREIFTIHEESK